MSIMPKYWSKASLQSDVEAHMADDIAAVQADATAGKAIVVNAEITLATNTNVGYVVVPVAGTVTSIYSVINGVLTTGDETLSFAVTGGTTMGDIVITQSGSAAGDVDTLAPSANNTVSAGSTIDITTDGANGTASIAQISVLVTPS